MSLFSEQCAHRIITTLLNLRNEVDTAIPINEHHTIRIKSSHGTPAIKQWNLTVKITTNITPDDEDSPHIYLHEVNEDGREIVDEWNHLIQKIDWLENETWNFMLSEVYDCGNDVTMAVYSQSISVATEDLLESLQTDERLVKVSYNVPREVFAVVDDSVDITEAQEVLTEIPNIGYRSLPLVELEPHMVAPSLSPRDAPSIPTIDLDEVWGLSIDTVDSEHAKQTNEAMTDE